MTWFGMGIVLKEQLSRQTGLVQVSLFLNHYIYKNKLYNIVLETSFLRDLLRIVYF